MSGRLFLDSAHAIVTRVEPLSKADYRYLVLSDAFEESPIYDLRSGVRTILNVEELERRHQDELSEALYEMMEAGLVVVVRHFLDAPNKEPGWVELSIDEAKACLLDTAAWQWPEDFDKRKTIVEVHLTKKGERFLFRNRLGLSRKRQRSLFFYGKPID